MSRVQPAFRAGLIAACVGMLASCALHGGEDDQSASALDRTGAAPKADAASSVHLADAAADAALEPQELCEGASEEACLAGYCSAFRKWETPGAEREFAACIQGRPVPCALEACAREPETNQCYFTDCLPLPAGWIWDWCSSVGCPQGPRGDAG